MSRQRRRSCWSKPANGRNERFNNKAEVSAQIVGGFCATTYEKLSRVSSRDKVHSRRSRRKPPSLVRSALRGRPYCAERKAEHLHTMFSRSAEDDGDHIPIFASCTSSPRPTFPSIAEKFRETFHSTYRRGKMRTTPRRAFCDVLSPIFADLAAVPRRNSPSTGTEVGGRTG